MKLSEKDTCYRIFWVGFGRSEGAYSVSKEVGIFCSLRGKAERGVTEGAYSVRGYFLACLGGKTGGVERFLLRGSSESFV